MSTSKASANTAARQEAIERCDTLAEALFNAITPEVKRMGDGSVPPTVSLDIVFNAIAHATALFISTFSPVVDAEKILPQLNRHILEKVARFEREEAEETDESTTPVH